ncbi:peptidylprolyl isomerase [Candidatus Pelagibacter sp. HIMB1509]|uniref:peptidylprolyl isomerase n=1 Tax=Candidatus Pelagibacter sp. HIMB1509 TaxID=3413339 RepID=UPI003F8560FC
MITYTIKKLSFLILIILFCSYANSLENKILLKIDNDIITSIDLEKEINYLTALNPNIKNLEKKRVLKLSMDSLVREKIKHKELLKYIDKLDVEEQYLNILMESMIVKLGLNSKEEFNQYLKRSSVDIKEVNKKLKIEIAWNQLIYSKFSKNLKIDKNKIKKNLMSEDNLITNSYLLSEILFDLKNMNNFKKKLDLIKNDINEKGFENAALIHSISESSSLGGNVGWINENTLNSKIKNEISKLSINQYTKPIQVPAGFLILKVNDIKKIKKKFNLNEEIEKIVKVKTNQQLNQFANIYFNKIKKEIKIDEL